MSVFLDWCPRATNAIDPITFSLESETKRKIDDIVESVSAQSDIRCHLLECHYRNDGIILFSIKIVDLESNPVALPYEKLISLAAIISNNVKSLIGHTHVYDTDYCAKGARVRFPSISKHPVLVSEINGEPISGKELSSIILDNNELVSLYSVNRNSERRRSILLVRERFSKIFDKSFIAVSRVKQRKLLGASARLRYFDGLLLILIVGAIFSIFHFMSVDKAKLLATGAVNVLTAFFFYTLYNAMHIKHYLDFVYKLLSNDQREFLQKLKIILLGALQYVFGLGIRKAVGEIYHSKLLKKVYARFVFAVAILSPVILSCDVFQPIFPMTPKIMSVVLSGAEYYSLDGVLTSFTYRSFSHWWMSNIFLISWILPVFMFVFEVSFKRRKVLQILKRAEGMMEFGSIYNGVSQNIFMSTKYSDIYSNSVFQNFDHAISIIKYRLELERKKRNKAFALYTVMFSFCVSLAVYDIFFHEVPTIS